MATSPGHAFDELRNTVNDGLRVLRQRWRLALCALTLVGAAAFWGSQYLPREYHATTLFERRDDVVLQNLIQSNSPYSFAHLKTTLSLDMLGSRALARAAAVTGLARIEGLEGEGPLTDVQRAALDDTIGRYGLRASVTLPQSSPSFDTVLVDVAANDPTVARAFVTALRDNYISQTRERIREILKSARDFFKAEIARRQQEVAAAEGLLRDGFDSYPGLDPTNLPGVGNHLETLRLQRASAQQHKAELEAQIAAREQFLVAAPSTLNFTPETPRVPVPQQAPDSPAERAIQAVIDSTKTQLIECRTMRRMTEEHPEVIKLVQRLEALDDLRLTIAAATSEPELAAAAPEPGESEELRQWRTQKMRVELELDALRRQLDVAAKQYEECDLRVAHLSALYDRLLAGNDEFRRLADKKAQGANEIGLWQSHLINLERILTAESGDRGTQFSLIEEPDEVALPTRPRLMTVWLACLGLGLGAAVLLVALAELFDRSFRSTGQVIRALGIPVLECVGVIGTPRERRRARVSRLVWGPAMAVLLCLFFASAGMAYISLARPDLHRRALQRVDHVLNAVGLGQGSTIESGST